MSAIPLARTVAVTGSAGTVGRALCPRLRDFHVVGIDKPGVDILTEPERLARAFAGADTVVHLAFDPGGGAAREHWRTTYRNPVNDALFGQVLRVALSTGVELFLHASSIHVEDTLAYSRRPPSMLTAKPGGFQTIPTSGYGQGKRDEEAALQQVADRFPRGAVSLRLGAVTPDDRPLRDNDNPEVLDHERRVWLSHRDLADLGTKIICRKATSDYDVVYAVSDNIGRFHDVSNRYGW
jgi:nucleoside-diphosphate-sugar epimerase